jgi:hypothetical protein
MSVKPAAKLAKTVDLRAYRARKISRRPPLVVSAHPDAVVLVVNDKPVWMTPLQAIDFAQDVLRMAAHAWREGGSK